MDLVELGAVLGEFFEDGKGPSHDQLDQAFVRAGLSSGDPAPGGRTPEGSPLGKTKRIRQVFVHATDNDPAAGLRLALHIVALMRAHGAFTPTLGEYAGSRKVNRLKEAFSRVGYTLEHSGALRRTVIDNLVGTELTDALRSYVNRINLNPDDVPLQIGSGKELTEAVARHVLQEHTGSYPSSGRAGSFPVTLANAFTVLGLQLPPETKLHDDPHRQVQQCLFLLALAANRLRNSVGTGHGRPGQLGDRSLTPVDARMVARATALVAGALLDRL